MKRGLVTLALVLCLAGGGWLPGGAAAAAVGPARTIPPRQGPDGTASAGASRSIPALVEPDPQVWDMIDQVGTDDIYEYLREFTGEEPVWVDGDWYTISTRYTFSGEPIEKTTHYVGERLAALGLDVEYHVWADDTNPNVIGQYTGLVNPDDIYIIGGHIDTIPGTPGADDNASGTIAALIAAQIMTHYRWSCTLRFAAWTGEEQWLLGSQAYAERAWMRGENILGYLNEEMISWNDPGSRPGMYLQYKADMPDTLQMARLFADVVKAYDLDLNPYMGTSMGYYGSDHMAFWEYGFPAAMVAEDWAYDLNPHYHQLDDAPANTDAAYLTDMVKASIATFAHMTGCLMPGGMGRVDGLVKAADGGAPLEGAHIRAEDEAGHGFVAPTDVSGAFTRPLLNGTYSVTAAAYGYLPATAAAVEVVTGTVTTQDFALEAASYYAVSGHVTEAGTGAPLLAQVEFDGSPVAVWTDPADGSYQAALPVGSYTMKVGPERHLAQERAIGVVDGDQVQDFSLEPAACVLLVDDDQDVPDVQPYYTYALDAIGADYDVWDVAAEASPDLNTLRAHKSVVWFLGDASSFTLTSSDEWKLADYLDGGGHLLLVAQDYLREMDLTPFGLNYLHVGSWANNVEQTVVTGKGLYSGLGPYVLSYPFENASDEVNPDLRSMVAFDGNHGNAAVSFDAAFRTVFLGFPFEAMPPVGRLAVMQRTIEHFGGCEPDTGWLEGRVTDARSGDPIGGALVTAVPSPRGGVEGLTDPDGFYTFTLPAGVYEVTASKDGYVAQTVGGVEVQAGLTTTQDLALEPVCVPVGGLAFTWEPGEPRAGEVVTFTATATGTLPIAFEWDFGDGGTGSGAVASHGYEQAGVFVVTATATNGCGREVVQQTVAVERVYTVCLPFVLRSNGGRGEGASEAGVDWTAKGAKGREKREGPALPMMGSHDGRNGAEEGSALMRRSSRYHDTPPRTSTRSQRATEAPKCQQGQGVGLQ